MKKSKQCPKCQSLRVAYLPTQVDEGDVYYNRKVARTKKSGFYGVSPGVGELEAYLCADCGYFETYVKEPKKMEWDKLIDLQWVNPPQQDEPGPCR